MTNENKSEYATGTVRNDRAPGIYLTHISEEGIQSKSSIKRQLYRGYLIKELAFGHVSKSRRWPGYH